MKFIVSPPFWYCVFWICMACSVLTVLYWVIRLGIAHGMADFVGSGDKWP